MIKLITTLLLTTVMFLPVVRCNVNVNTNFDEKEEDNSSSYSEKSTEKKSEKSTENKTGENKDKKEKATENNSSIKEIGDVKFWITTVEKTEPKADNGIEYIFDEAFGFPIDLSNIEGDGQYLNDIKEALTSEDSVTQNYAVNSATASNKPTVYFANYTDAILKVSDCYENNWWFMCLTRDSIAWGNLEGIFNPEIGRKPIYDMEAKTSPVLNALIDELGSPDNIYIRRGDAYAYKYKGSSSIVDYDLIWTTADYTLVIGVCESYFEEYDTQLLSITSVSYYTSETWGYQKIYLYDANCKEYIIE